MPQFSETKPAMGESGITTIDGNLRLTRFAGLGFASLHRRQVSLSMPLMLRTGGNGADARHQQRQSDQNNKDENGPTHGAKMG